MMKRCEDFQTATGKRHYGAADAAELRLLAAHLADCPECRAFDVVSSTAEEMMKEMLGEEALLVDWAALGAKLRRSLRAAQLEVLVAATLYLGLLAGKALVAGSGLFAAKESLPIVVIVSGFVGLSWWRLRIRRRDLASAIARDDVAMLRAELDRQIRVIRGRSWWRYLLPACLVPQAAGLWLSGPSHWQLVGFVVWCGLQFYLVHMLYERFGVLRRLVRGRQALG